MYAYSDSDTYHSLSYQNQTVLCVKAVFALYNQYLQRNSTLDRVVTVTIKIFMIIFTNWQKIFINFGQHLIPLYDHETFS